MKSNDLSKYRLSESNPFAPPDRRYRLAKACVHSGRRLSFRDDKPTWELYRYLRAYEAACEPSQRADLRRLNPDLAQAIDLHHGRARKLRPFVEAYILGDLNDEALGMRLGLSTKCITRFRQSFYDCAHARDTPLRILHDVIGVTDESGQSAMSDHKRWKLIGFVLKSAALDELFNYGVRPGKLPQAGLAEWLSQQGQSTLEFKQWIATDKLNIDNPKHLDTLLKLRLQEMCRQAHSKESTLSPNDEHIKAMMEDIPWAVGEDGEKLYEGTPIGKWDESAVEPHADELNLLGAGKPAPTLDDELLSFTLPPPRKRRPGDDLDGSSEILK